MYKLRKKIIRVFLFLLLLSAGVFFLYFNNLKLADEKTREFYYTLKDSLSVKGFSANLLVISTKRAAWHNKLQEKFSGAAKNSRHLTGDAIDFLVFDVNYDGSSNSKDVDLVYDILDKLIIKEKGGIGTYKNEQSFINRQMIHIDCRGYKARWAR